MSDTDARIATIVAVLNDPKVTRETLTYEEYLRAVAERILASLAKSLGE